MSAQNSKQASDPRPGETRPPVPPRLPPANPRRAPIRAEVLGYEAPRSGDQESPGVQFFLGMFSPICYGIVAGIIGAVVSSINIVPDTVLIWFGVAGYIAFVAWVRIAFGWRAFIPGALLTALGIPLLFIVICGPML